MAGLPHFRNSKAAVSLYEPLYLNQFEVLIQPPPAVSNPLGLANRTLLVENLLSFSIKSVDKNPRATAVQNYKFAQRRYAGGAVDDTAATIDITFETNIDDNGSNYVYKTLRQWHDLIYNPLTGAMGLKRTYANQTYMLVNIFDKEGNVYKQIKLYNCFPIKAIDAYSLAYENGTTLYKINAQFRADYFDDIFN
jgi:hypothetical protein